MSAVCAKQAVRRAQANRVAALARDSRDEFAQRRRVAKAVIARAPQRIELNAESPQSFARRDVLKRDTARRRDRQSDVAFADVHPMIAGRADRRHDGTAILRG